MSRIGFFVLGNNNVQIQLKLFEQLISQESVEDVEIFSTKCEVKVLIPLIAYLYNYAAKTHPNKDLTIVPVDGEMGFADGYDVDTVKLEITDIEIGNVICIGGTFDHIHYGHKLLITAAALLTRETLIVGINMAISRKQFVELIQPLHVRVAKVSELIYKVNDKLTLYLQPITDPAGPAATYPKIDVLVLSQETMNGGNYVNNIREKNGLPKTRFYVIPLVNDIKGDRVNSTEIREKIKMSNN